MGTGVNWAGQVCNSWCMHSPLHLTIALFISLAELSRVQAVQRIAAITPSGTGLSLLFIPFVVSFTPEDKPAHSSFWSVPLFQLLFLVL